MLDCLHLYSTLVAPSQHPLTLYNGLSFTLSLIHSYTNRGCCHAKHCPPHWKQFRMKCLAQGHNNLTANPLVIWKPALPTTYWVTVAPLNLYHRFYIAIFYIFTPTKISYQVEKFSNLHFIVPTQQELAALKFRYLAMKMAPAPKHLLTKAPCWKWKWWLLGAPKGDALPKPGRLFRSDLSGNLLPAFKLRGVIRAINLLQDPEVLPRHLRDCWQVSRNWGIAFDASLWAAGG